MENTPVIPAVTEDVLDEVEYILYQANGWKRFANWLVDNLAYYILFRLFLVNPLARFLVFIHVPLENRLILFLFAYLEAYSVFGVMIAGLEAATGGKTLGKYLTATRAVNDDGSLITLKIAVLRFLSRIVPFEVFSALGSPCYPWHDRWTKTVVIDERLTTLPPQD